MTSSSRVLLVEDTVPLARTYMAYLKGKPYEVVHVETGGRALEELNSKLPDVVLLDLMLPDMDGLDILREISKRQLPTAVIVITAHASVNVAVEAMRLGASDFLVKPFNADRLMVTLKNALEKQHLTRLVETYQSDIDRSTYCGFIGGSLPMQAVYRIIDSAARSKATVFVTGESGTGKEVCAEAIHRRSPRAEKAFIAINCGAIPKDLMESEIFGHVKGAFTGAVADREGAATRADGGTLFLDEIGEMDLNLQVKLLRFIQTGSFQKVGGSKMEVVDIRFVCATNKNPIEEVAAGRFREDLFYRLNVIPIQLPSLHERDDDVLAIAQNFLETFSQEEDRTFQRFSAETAAVFLEYSWPGNVRQLQNVVRNIVVLNEGDQVESDMLPPPLDEHAARIPKASAEGLPPDLPRAAGSAVTTAAAGDHWLPATPAEIRPLGDMERDIIERCIALCDDNIPKAASHLNISASTIYRKKAAWDDEAQ